jgi:hypothetical protein
MAKSFRKLRKPLMLAVVLGAVGALVSFGLGATGAT